MSNGGTLLIFTLAGGKDEAFRVLFALRPIDISNNLGDSNTLACYPGSTTHTSISAEERVGMGSPTAASGCRSGLRISRI